MVGCSAAEDFRKVKRLTGLLSAAIGAGRMLRAGSSCGRSASGAKRASRFRPVADLRLGTHGWTKLPFALRLEAHPLVRGAAPPRRVAEEWVRQVLRVKIFSLEIRPIRTSPSHGPARSALFPTDAVEPRAARHRPRRRGGDDGARAAIRTTRKISRRVSSRGCWKRRARQGRCQQGQAAHLPAHLRAAFSRRRARPRDGAETRGCRPDELRFRAGGGTLRRQAARRPFARPSLPATLGAHHPRSRAHPSRCGIHRAEKGRHLHRAPSVSRFRAGPGKALRRNRR